MSDATNNTTRTATVKCYGVDRQISQVVWCEYHCRPWSACVIERLSDDLLRLAGPVCDHPPCKGARAIEHQRCPSAGTIGCLLNYAHDMCSPRNHPHSPAIEAWLRARSAK